MIIEIKTYKFNTSNVAENRAYNALCEKLKDGRNFFNVLAGPGEGKSLQPGRYEVDTGTVFSNQVNTVGEDGKSGLRVFDWYEGIYPNRSWKAGHYIADLSELNSYRENMHCCGYCGKQEPAAKGYVFCPHCLDSEYLEEKNLGMLRMRPVSIHSYKTPELTAAEKKHLLPLFVKAQTFGNSAREKKRIASAFKDVETKRTRAIENAENEYEGFKFLLDNGLKTNNVIYYSHTGRFSFGWRRPFDSSSRETYEAAMKDAGGFPCPFDFKAIKGA